MEQKFPTEIIDLPSQGFFYASENPLSSGKIELKYMTAKEEDILTSRNLIQKGTALDMLLKSLIVTPIDYNTLLIGDKNAVLVASRILAYGKDYGVTVSCPKCGEKNEEAVVDISTFENKEIDTAPFTKGSRIFTYELPFSKRTVGLKLATHADERNIDGEIKGMKKISAQTGVDSEMTTRLRNIIVSIDGDSSREAINKFVNSELLAKDSFELRQFLRHNTPDIDMTTEYACPSCGETSKIQVPLTTDFFWPTGRE